MTVDEAYKEATLMQAVIAYETAKAEVAIARFGQISAALDLHAQLCIAKVNEPWRFLAQAIRDLH